MQILVSFESFLEYQEKYGTTYLDKKYNYQIWSPSKTNILNGVSKINEIFDGLKTEYTFDTTTDEIKNNYLSDGYLITFLSNSGNKYRLDLIQDYYLKETYHIAFSLYNKDIFDDDYEKLTELNEAKEVFGRLAYVLKGISKNNPNLKEFCIGGTGNPKKDRIYEYMMRYVSKWEKRKDSEYKIGWALYFTM